ncbi:MAG: PEP-CTERM sorting domain-containing protein [Armatimonadota bacterium]
MKGIIVGTLFVGLAGTALARPELNAFINKPANSVPELIAQIKSDKQVADRFMRHFSMSKEEVMEYVGTLHLGSLQESRYYTIYSAPENGVIKSHVSFFKKGTPAFVDSDGNAILRVKCANPFVPGPIRPYSTFAPTVKDSNSIPIGVMPVGPTSSDSIDAVSTPPEPLRPDVDTPLTLKTTPTTSSPNVFAGNSIASVLGLGGAAVFVHRGSHSSVPEPASMVAIALGVGVLATRRRKKK